MKQLTVTSSILMCVGLGITYLMLPEQGSVAIYHTAAVGAALAIGMGILPEAQMGIRSLIRTDLVALAALYGLTLVEFFFPQGDLAVGAQQIELTVGAQTATQGVKALFIGFVGLIIGRHLAPTPRPAATSAMDIQLSPRTLFRLYLLLL